MRASGRLGLGLAVVAVALVLLATAVGIGVAGALWTQSRAAADDSPVIGLSGERAPVPAAPPAAARLVTVTIDSIPAHALVLQDGVPIGATPMMLRVPRTPSWDLEVTAEGYTSYRQHVFPDFSRRYVAHLTPIPLRQPSSVTPPPQTMPPIPSRPTRARGSIIPTPPEVLSSGGRIDRGEIFRGVTRGVRLQMGAITRCYERRGAPFPANSLFGETIVFRWRITEAGRVDNVAVRSSTVSDGPLESCIAGAIRGMRFPPPEGGAVTVTQPFLLTTIRF